MNLVRCVIILCLVCFLIINFEQTFFDDDSFNLIITELGPNKVLSGTFGSWMIDCQYFLLDSQFGMCLKECQHVFGVDTVSSQWVTLPRAEKGLLR